MALQQNYCTTPNPAFPSVATDKNRKPKSHEQVGGFELTESYIHDFYLFIYLAFAGLYSSAAYCGREKKDILQSQLAINDGKAELQKSLHSEMLKTRGLSWIKLLQ